MNENDDQLQQPSEVPQPTAELPSWQEIQQTPEYQASKPEDRLVAFSRWHDAAYNAAKEAPDWKEYEGEFNRQAAGIQSELSKAAGGIDPDMARLKVAMDAVKTQEGSLGRPLNDDEKANTIQSLGPDIAKAYNEPPSVFQRLYRPIAAFGEGFASGLGQTLQTIGYFASQPGSMVTKLENKLFGTPTQEEVLKKYTGDEHPLEWLGRRLQTVATAPEAESALDPRTKGGLSEAVGHTAGGLLEFLGESALGGAELKAAGLVGKAGSLLSKEAAGKLAAMSVFGIHNAAEGINHARDMGVPEDQVLSSALAYGTVGATTAAFTPFQKWLGKFDEATGGELTDTLKKAITEGGQFAAQMFTQQLGNNAVNRVVLAENTDLLKDTFEQAKSGGATGVVASLVLAALLHGKTAFKPGERVTQTTETPSGQVSIEASQEALDRINTTAAPQTAAVAREAVTGEKPAKATVVEEQPTISTPAELDALATGVAGEPTTMTPQEKAYSDKVDHFWQWGRANNPEQVQAIHDAAGRGDFAERDKLYNDLKTQWRNSPDSDAVAVKPTLEEQAKPVIQDLVQGNTTPDEFADKIADMAAAETQHQQELPQLGKQPRLALTPDQQAKLDEQVKRETGLKGTRPGEAPTQYTEAELDKIVEDINKRRKEEENAPRGGPGLATEDHPRLETFSSLTPEEVDKLRKAQPSSKLPPKIKQSLSELGYTDEEIGKLTPQKASTAIVNAQQGTEEVGKFTREKKRTPAVEAEGGITPTKSRAELIDEYSKAKANEDARVAGATGVSPGKAIGRSPAQIERDIIVNDVKDQRAKAQEANKPFNVRQAVVEAKANFENQFNTEPFNPFKEPGIGETEQQKAAQKAQVQVFRDSMIEQLKTATTPEQKADIATEFLRKVKDVEGTLHPERTQQAEFYAEPPTEEFKQIVEKRITDRVLQTGVLPPDSRAMSVGIGSARAKKLYETLQTKLSEAYPRETVTPDANTKVYEKNQWLKGGKGGGPIVEGQSQVTGDKTPVVISRTKTDRVDARGKPVYEYSQRPLYTNDPKITAIQLGRLRGDDHVYIPDELVKKEQINPAIHIKQDPDSGRYYVDNVDTFLGNIGEPGRRTSEGRLAEPNEFEKLYEQAGFTEKAGTPVRPGDEAKFEAVARKEGAQLEAPVAPEELLGREEAAAPTGTLADVWPVEQRESTGDTGSLEGREDVSSGMERYSEEEALPTDAQLHEFNFTGELPDNLKGKISSDPTSSANQVDFARQNEADIDRLKLRDPNAPVLNAVRTIASLENIPAEQRQLAKDLLANDKIDLSKVKVNIADLKQHGFAAAYGNGEVFIDPSQNHEGGVISSVLHEVGHHILDAKLEPDYQRNAVEERVYQQRQKLFDHARQELYKQAHDGQEGTPEEIEAWVQTKPDRSLYALTTPDELFSEVFSRNDAARDALSKVAPMKGYTLSTQGKFANFLDQIINAIKSFLSGKAVNKNSLYDQVWNEVLGLTREGEPRPRTEPIAAPEEIKGTRSQAQDDINGALEQMSRPELEQAAMDHGLHKDEVLSMTQPELRARLGYKATTTNLEAEQLGEGYGGWLAKDGTYHSAEPSVDTGSSGHGEAARIILEDLGASPEEHETPVSALQERGYVRIVNDHYQILADGTPTDKQKKMLIDTGMEQGKAVVVSSLNPPYKQKVIYSPRKVYAKAGTPQQPTPPNQPPNVSWLKGVDLIVAGKDSANNVANRRGNEANVEIRQDFGNTKKLTPEQIEDTKAASLVRQAGGDRNFMLTEMKKIQDSQVIDQKEKDKWLPIYQHGYDNFDRLNQITQNGMFNKIMNEQLERLRAVDIPVKERDNYISQMVDKPDTATAGIFDFLKPDDGGAGSSRFFMKGRKFNTFADAIAAGYLPKSGGTAHPLEINEIAHRYVELTERLIQTKELENRLANTPAFDGKPIIGATDEYTSVAGNKHTTIPRGYKMVQTGGKPLVVHEAYAPIIEFAYSDSNLPRPLRKTLGFIKRNTLMFDTFHVGRIMSKEFFYSKGSSRFGYNKGLSLLEYSDRAWNRALQSGEVTPEMDKFRNEKVYGDYSRRQIVLELEKAGANFGKVADNLFASHVRSIPYLKNFNPWVFQKLSRGAMAQTAVENWIRNMKRFNELGVEGNARRTAKEYNEVFGNLQNQRIFKNKFYKNTLDAIALAPNWAESQLLAEARGVAQVGRAAYDTIRGNPRVGTVAQGQISMVLGMLAFNQLMNYMSRGHSTFENKEEGHKLDAFIPDLQSGGRGFWFNPFEIAAEYTHALHKYTSQHQTLVDAASQVAKNKLNPLSRGVTELVSGRDYAGRRFNSMADRITASVADAAPVPLTFGGVVERDPRKPLGLRFNRQPGAGEKQLLQSVGLKVSNYQSPRSQMFALAYPFRNDKSYTDNAGEYTELRRALDNGNHEAAVSEIRLLASRGKTERQLKAAVGISPTGSVAPENFTGSKSKEAEMRKALTPDQLALYKQAQKDHIENAKSFLRIFREVRPDILDVLKANDKARK